MSLNKWLSLGLMIKAANSKGAIIPAILLHMPMMLMRWAALSSGPIIVTYGLAAVCSSDNPIPMINKPVRNNGYDREFAAGMKTKAPTAIIQKPIIMPFLKPVFFRTKEAG